MDQSIVFHFMGSVAIGGGMVTRRRSRALFVSWPVPTVTSKAAGGMMETMVEPMRTLLGALLVPAVLVAASCTGNGATSSSTVPSASASGSTAVEFIIHVEKPKNIGEEDWANPTLETAWETACPEDLGKEGFSWGGRSYNVSEGGMDATIRCDDGSRHSVQIIFDSPSGG